MVKDSQTDLTCKYEEFVVHNQNIKIRYRNTVDSFETTPILFTEEITSILQVDVYFGKQLLYNQQYSRAVTTIQGKMKALYIVKEVLKLLVVSHFLSILLFSIYICRTIIPQFTKYSFDHLQYNN